MIQRKIGEIIWAKLELGHRGELEYTTVLDPVSKNLRRDVTRDRQGPGDLLTFGRLDLLGPFFQLGYVPELHSEFSSDELCVSREAFGRDIDPAFQSSVLESVYEAFNLASVDLAVSFPAFERYSLGLLALRPGRYNVHKVVARVPFWVILLHV